MQTNTEAQLTPAESRDLCRIAGLMIPASDAFGVPGADDAIIFADIIRSLGRDLGDVRDALAELAALAGGTFVDADDAHAEILLTTLLARGDRVAAALGRVVLQCYYRDDRVLIALGLEARAP